MIYISSKKYLYMIIGALPWAVAGVAMADCTKNTGSGENTADGGQYIQNASINCTGNTNLNGVIGNSTYAIGGVKISQEASQIIRWSNIPHVSGYEVGINVDDGAVVNAEGLDKGALLIHSGFYTRNGAGVEVSNSFISPEHPINAKIINNGTVNYFNPGALENNNRNTSAAISIEGNDGPANQIIINDGNVFSQSAWGIVSSGVAVKDIYESGVFNRQELTKVDEYKYSYENTVKIINNKIIIQEIGGVESGTLYDGHSAAVAIFQPSVKSISIINSSTGLIQGAFSGVDLLINRTSDKSFLDNSGLIIGGSRGISITKSNISDEIGYNPYFDEIINRAGGFIKGTQAGIFNQGSLGTIENYGEIEGVTASIDVSNGAVTSAINNYGSLKGNVLLGSNQLNLLASDKAMEATPRVDGDILGDAQSVVRITPAEVFTNFQATGNADVGAIYIDAGSHLTLANGVVWKASSNQTLNRGAVSLAENAVSANFSGVFNNQGTVGLGCESCGAQTLVIDGDYQGEAGTSLLSLYTKLGTDGSETDKLTINGHATGTTLVKVNNKNGLGDKTSKGIEVIQTTSSDAEAFQQSGRIVAGSYDYFLQKGDEAGGNVENWYLVSHLSSRDPDPIYRPEIGSYLANLAAADSMFNMRFTDRVGEIIGSRGNSPSTDTSKNGFWMRATGSQKKFDENTGNLRTKTNQYLIQLGKDIYQEFNGDTGGWRFGLMAGYGHASSHTRSDMSGNSSEGKVDGYSIGAYGTWTSSQDQQNGAYIDTWLLANRFNAKTEGQGLEKEKYKTNGVSASLESGYGFEIKETENYNYWLTPQAQIIWSHMRFNEFVDQQEAIIKNKNSNHFQLRLGLRGTVKSKDINGVRKIKNFAELNWINNVKKHGISFHDEDFYQVGNKNIGELKLGMEGDFSLNSSGWIDLSKQWGSHSFSDFKINIGAKFNFY